jgi:hypothetical protein
MRAAPFSKPPSETAPSAAKHFGGYDSPRVRSFSTYKQSPLKEVNMNQQAALDAALATSVPQKKTRGGCSRPALYRE